MKLLTGAQAVVEMVVTADDTAVALGTAEVLVLATPRVVALCETASVRALADQLAPGQVSVSTRVELAHVAPVNVGSHIRATATFERTEGRRFIFNVTVNDACGLVAAGKVTRVIVDRDQFMEKAR